MAKFFFFEKIVQLFYTRVFTQPKDTYSKPTQLGVTFTSGYLSGVVCAIVSHPADSLVSQLGKPQNKGKSLGAIVNEVGFGTLATKGLGTRVIMIGTLTGMFWFSTFPVIIDLTLACRLPMVDLR
jgi:solute carrier family 25 (mitochondrial phosphate transporter), member 3